MEIYNMTEKQYIMVMDFIRSKRYGVKSVYIAGKVITALTALVYILTVAWLAYLKDIRVIRVSGVPAAGFLLVSFSRKLYNAQRPYERYNFKPLVPKDTHGKSFPSRHVFSAFACAGAAYYICPVAGVSVYIMGIMLAVIRVVTGVHFPKDVFAGAVAGILCTIAGFTGLF